MIRFGAFRLVPIVALVALAPLRIVSAQYRVPVALVHKLLAGEAQHYIHPEQHRTLSIREAARIQTFPDWFRFAGSRSHAFQQIGNAVPPLLATAMAQPLSDAGRRPWSQLMPWGHFIWPASEPVPPQV